MKNKPLLAVLLGIASFLLFFNGILRHDVAAEEYYKLADQKQFDCVADVRMESGSVASGVLVGQRYVLTAAHIAIDSDTREKTVTLGNGQEVIVHEPYNHRVRKTDGLYVRINGQDVKAKRFIIHPDYLSDLDKSQVDIMLIELEKPFKKVKPANLNNLFDESGYNVVGAGFGVSGTADKPNAIARIGRKTAGENVIDSIGGSKYGEHNLLLLCDFDHPTRTDCNTMGSAVPRPLEYICGGGDSGGGLFREKNGKWELVGICKGATYKMERFQETGFYGQEMRWTRVSIFHNWIKENIK